MKTDKILIIAGNIIVIFLISILIIAAIYLLIKII